jgi:hypothetical protein
MWNFKCPITCNRDLSAPVEINSTQMMKVAMKFTLLLGLLTGPHTVFAQAAEEPPKPPDAI